MNADPNPAKSIFVEAVERHTPDHWPAFLDRACAGQPELRCRVEALLAAHREIATAQCCELAEGAEPSPVIRVDGPPARGQRGTVIGPYKLLEQIGEGGFGVVFLAERTEPIRRRVALKILKPGMDSRQVVARFEAERQALALMDHPNIAKVFDAGTTDTGRPYFVMELVKGVPITEYCDQCNLPVRERLELFLSVCHAVQHAHQKGIIHRDLKPSNVLVAIQDGQPAAKVIDFGVAKAINQRLSEHTLLTGFHQMIGTPLYMSPEQAEMSPLDVDTRSDIYSLGVLLYELLSGTTPFQREQLKSASLDEIRRLIREQEPPRPSARISTLNAELLSTIAERRRIDPKKLHQVMRGELDWIVMKALEKDRNRRYETANAFALDVERYLSGEPVQAVPPSLGYRLRNFVRRNRRGLLLTAVLAGAIAVALGSFGWLRRDRAAQKSKLNRDVAQTLERADFFLAEGRRASALEAYRHAELLADGLTDANVRAQLAAVADRLEAGRKDEEFVKGFEAVRLLRHSHINEEENQFEWRSAFPAIRQLLADYSIEVGRTQPEEVAARVRSRPKDVQPELIAALYCSLSYAPKDDTENIQWLLHVLNAVDTDSLRTGVRAAFVKGDRPAFESLSRDLQVSDHPLGFLLWMDSAQGPLPTTARLEWMSRVRSAYPDDFWANHCLGWLLRQHGRTAEAVQYYTAAAALRPNNPGVLMNRGNALREAGYLDDALAVHQRVVELAPRYAAAYANLAATCQAKGLIDAATANYQRAIELGPDDAVTYYNFGNLKWANRDADGAIEQYRKAVALNPNYTSARYNLGVVLSYKREWQAAIRELRQAVALNPKHAQAFDVLGTALHAIQDFEGAIKAHQESVALDPNVAVSHYNLGNSLLKAGRFGEAAEAFRRAVALNPKLAKAHNNLAVALMRLNELDGAIEALRAAVAADPTLAAAHYNLADQLLKKGRRAEAVAAYRQAVQHGPNFDKARNALAWRLAVAANDSNADFKEALVLAETAVKSSPQIGAYWNTLGLVRFRCGDWDGARDALNRSMTLRGGGDGMDWILLAMAYQKLGDPKQARDWYDRAVEWMNKQVKRDEDADGLRAEAAALLKIEERA